MTKRKLPPAEKAEKKKRQQEYMTIFINGKQKRVKRPPTIDGIDAEEFMRRNADQIWLHPKRALGRNGKQAPEAKS
jgi:hypothetical protein